MLIFFRLGQIRLQPDPQLFSRAAPCVTASSSSNETFELEALMRTSNLKALSFQVIVQGVCAVENAIETKHVSCLRLCSIWHRQNILKVAAVSGVMIISRSFLPSRGSLPWMSRTRDAASPIGTPRSRIWSLGPGGVGKRNLKSGVSMSIRGEFC